MSQKKALRRRKKEQKKIARDVKGLSKRKDFINYLIKLTGNSDIFLKLPRNVKEAIYSVTWPQIAIDTSAVKDNPKIKEIEENIRYFLNAIKIKITEEAEIPVSNVHGLIGLYAIFNGVISDGQHYLSKKEDALNKITSKAKNKIRSECENALELCKIILLNLENVLDQVQISYISAISSIAGQEVLKDFSLKEKCLYPSIQVVKNEKAKRHPTITIEYFNPKEESVTIEGSSRKAYLCKGYMHKGLKDCILPPNTIDNEKPLPVYIQEHALNRIFERIGIDPRGYLYDCIGRSLLLHNVSATNGPAYLIDFDYYSKKLGYLVVSNEGDFAVVRSFKFLTMTGTPEFYKLKRELKGSREDFEYLGLDTLATFLNSDISNDPTLREIFTDCGLGHLFDIKHFHFEHTENLIADEIKQYFKLS